MLEAKACLADTLMNPKASHSKYKSESTYRKLTCRLVRQCMRLVVTNDLHRLRHAIAAHQKHKRGL